MAYILLIEPDLMLADSYTAALKRAGHKVKRHASGQAAIETADHKTPDLIILELQLGNHNGLEFLYELRSYPEWQGVPVIVQSVVPEETFATSAAWPLLGVEQYLYKPATKLEKLIITVEEVLQTAAV